MKIFYAAVVVLFLTACNNKKEEEATNPEIETENVDARLLTRLQKLKKITDRDFSVTKENAYNDMFLDSMAMETLYH